MGQRPGPRLLNQDHEQSPQFSVRKSGNSSFQVLGELLRSKNMIKEQTKDKKPKDPLEQCHTNPMEAVGRNCKCLVLVVVTCPLK